MQQQITTIQGASQYDDNVAPQYRSSACGPTSVFMILRYFGINTYPINALYKKLGTTKIGLFTWRLTQRLQKLLGEQWLVQKCSVHSALQELQKNRPVAMKFDTYFTRHLRTQADYAYHWVVVTGFSIENGELYLMIHDIGAPNRPSQLRKIHYGKNANALTFVQITPLQADIADSHA